MRITGGRTLVSYCCQFFCFVLTFPTATQSCQAAEPLSTSALHPLPKIKLILPPQPDNSVQDVDMEADDSDVDELEEDKLEEDEWMVVSSNISHFAFLTFITAAKEASDLQQGWECC
jgi:hypothetical protein